MKVREILQLKVELRPLYWLGQMAELYFQLDIRERGKEPVRISQTVMFEPDLTESQLDYYFDRARAAIKEELKK